jgi:hypothetical protein
VKNASRIVLSVVSGSILAVGAWALPARTANASLPQDASPPSDSAQLQSAAGKISSVGRSSFTLDIGSVSGTPQSQQFQQAPQSRAMIFQIDKNTSVTGKLAVGSNADVTYRVANGNNIAVNVDVMP